MKTHLIKKTAELFLTLLFLCSIVSAQVDSSAESFFPAQIGNIWRYQQGPFATQSTLKRDSLVNGYRFLFYDDNDLPDYGIDSILNVTALPNQGAYEAIQYKLKAQKGETWISQDTTSERTLRTVARVDDIYWGIVLGNVTQIKRIGYYWQSVTDTTDFNFWLHDDYLAAGFGFYLRITDASQTPSIELIGCIIDGKKYGTVVSAPDNSQYKVLSSCKLNPAFPDPFNSSTVISYHLSERNFVHLIVFDMLGREIKTLVNEQQQSGFHQIHFTPQNLSSGIYLVRIIAGNFTQTTKIIYQK